jgi:hypothetical protein
MKDINYTKTILNIIKTKANKMNSNIENNKNDYITENVTNNLSNVFNLGPPPLFQRSDISCFEEEEEEIITDDTFQNFQWYEAPHDYVMPMPCSKCYWVCCNGDCYEETDEMTLIPRKLFLEEEEEEMELPPPPRLTRILTNSHLPDDEPEEFYMPEDLQYVSLKVIIEEKEQDKE